MKGHRLIMKKVLRLLSIPALLLAGSIVANPERTHADSAAITLGSCTSSQSPVVFSNPYITMAGVTTNTGIPPAPATITRALVAGASPTSTGAPAATSTMPSAAYGFAYYLNGVQPVLQYGYRLYLDEGLFTFYSSSTQTEAASGAVTSATRTGTFNIYLSTPTSGHYYNPDTFRAGMPILTTTFGEQILEGADGQTFTTNAQATITAASPFSVNGTCYQFGVVGQKFAIAGSGQLVSLTLPTTSFTAAISSLANSSTTSTATTSASPAH